MTNILIIESNPPDLIAKEGAGADAFVQTLGLLDATVTTQVAAPYAAPFSQTELTGIDGVIFTGSGVNWSAADAKAEPLADAMRAVFVAGLPTYGSCNGAQLAAHVLGGQVGASPNGAENGLALDCVKTDAGRTHPLLNGRRDLYSAPCVHYEEVSQLPKGAVLLSGNSHSPVQAFAYLKDGVDFWGCQYHPEFSAPFIGKIVNGLGDPYQALAVDLMVAETDAVAARRIGTTSQDMQVQYRAIELANWLDHVRGGIVERCATAK